MKIVVGHNPANDEFDREVSYWRLKSSGINIHSDLGLSIIKPTRKKWLRKIAQRLAGYVPKT